MSIVSQRASQRGGLKSGDLIVGSASKNLYEFSAALDPVVHKCLSDAKTEAARLAATDKTRKYVVIEVKAIASVNDVVWE